MGGKAKTSREMRHLRHRRVRRQLVGSAARPRLSVFRSLRHVVAQLIDDSSGRTLVASSSLEPAVRQQLVGKKGKLDSARMVGALVAQRAKERGILRAVFDRGGYQYHGRVKALAEAAREGGLEF